MRIGLVILPVYRWKQAASVWRQAEQAGFDSAWTYDHLSWRDNFRDGPWFGAVPTLTAAAAVTSRIRLGTLVTNPNFREPVTLAKDVMSIDDVSDGRLTLGIGAGGEGFDTQVFGREPWTPKERADRFAEFVTLLDALLSQDATTYDGRFYSAHEARMVPGCVQRPRLPFAIAAEGPRGMRLAAAHGQHWVTTGDSKNVDAPLGGVVGQQERLDKIVTEAGRDPATLGRIMLTGFTPEQPLESVDAFVDLCGRYAEAGMDELVIHRPIPDTQFAADERVFEKIITEGLPQVQ